MNWQYELVIIKMAGDSESKDAWSLIKAWDFFFLVSMYDATAIFSNMKTFVVLVIEF